MSGDRLFSAVHPDDFHASFFCRCTIKAVRNFGRHSDAGAFAKSTQKAGQQRIADVTGTSAFGAFHLLMFVLDKADLPVPRNISVIARQLHFLM